MKWFLKALNNYSTFSGRARRSEFWFFGLFHLIFSIVAMVLDSVLGINFHFGHGFSLPYGYIWLLFELALIIPALAVTVRRLHDVGKSGWMYFICLIPLIGGIWLLVLFFTDSQSGSNKWGENPKEIGSF